MPRPSMKEARRDQILDAAEICAAHDGVDGLTLERVAEEAGLARALIRHNIGNRDALIDALADRFLARSQAEMDTLFAELPLADTSRTLVDWLFDPTAINAHDIRVADALISFGAKHPDTARKMRHWTEKAWADTAGVLSAEFPDAGDETVDAAAAGILGLYFNLEASAALGPMRAYRNASKRAALMLLEALAR